ncbi:unnamed protein product [Rotaria sordida]|uniref:Uncharacterized protein n=1 Tax=Rotaria sordida TaxID=392033 RepID=A0A819N759_9BILA|nr:unnamed protein product [Rotaria sordida]
MSNRSFCGSNKFLQNYRPRNSTYDYDRCKLPAINNGITTMSNMNSSICKSPLIRSCVPQINENCSTQYSNLYKNNCNTGITNNLSTQINCTPSGPAIYNARTPSYNNCKINCPSRGSASLQTFSSPLSTSTMYNDIQQAPVNRCWSSNQFIGCDKTNITNTDLNKNSIIDQSNNCPQRSMISGSNGFNCSQSNLNICTGQKTIVRDRHLANEILQKAGISSNITSNDCLEVITDTPVTINDNVNCDPDPLCMKKPADCQECYEQSIVVRHLQPPRPPVPPPIIIRERCGPQPPPQPPIVIRQIPPRPSTPPPLIIRECPPPMPALQEPTIIEREVPPPPPPPRQVIVERLPTPPPKPRSIIFEKWLPYEEPEDRPCIVEKVTTNEIPPPKNLIIQYEALEPRIQSQCINEGISCVDPKQFVNDTPPNGNAEICYVDQLHNLPDHIKCQLSPQALAAIGIKNNNNNKEIPSNNPCVVRTNPPCFYQQQTRMGCPSIRPMSSRHSMMTNAYHSAKSSYSQLCNSSMYRQQQQQQQQPSNRILSTSSVCLPQCFNKYNTNILARPGNQGLTNITRGHYNPWATTYQVSYTNKARGMCRTR